MGGSYAFCHDALYSISWLNYTPERQWYGETEAGIQQYFEQLQKGNIQVMLKPQIWVRDGAFTGRIKMNSPKDWKLFESQYSAFILRFARLAQQLDIPLFCIGTELKAFVRARPEFGKALLKTSEQFIRESSPMRPIGMNMKRPFFGTP